MKKFAVKTTALLIAAGLGVGAAGSAFAAESLQDVMNTVMGDLVSPFQEELIVRRDDNSWLIDGATPIEDVMQALEIEVFEGFQNYETVAGFLMYRLRKVPKRTDFVTYLGYKFEVVDIDNYRIDQVLVTRETPVEAP